MPRATESKDLLLTKIIAIIENSLGIERNEITLNANLEVDLGADSLDIVELVMCFEEAFKIEIPDLDAEKLVSVRDIYNYLTKREVKA